MDDDSSLGVSGNDRLVHFSFDQSLADERRGRQPTNLKLGKAKIETLGIYRLQISKKKKKDLPARTYL